MRARFKSPGPALSPRQAFAKPPSKVPLSGGLGEGGIDVKKSSEETFESDTEAVGDFSNEVSDYPSKPEVRVPHGAAVLVG